MPPVQIASAGSAQAVIRQIAEAFCTAHDCRFALRHGPAGLLAQQILDGVPTDIYISASSSGPERLRQAGLFGAHRVIARNRMVLVARPGLSFADDDPLSWLAVPGLKLATSTPGADPSGDYAAAFLRALMRDKPVLGQDVASRTAALFGASLPDPSNPSPSPAARIVRDGRADLLVVYETSAQRIVRELPGARAIPLPDTLSPPTQVCASLRVGGPDGARALFEHLSGETAAKIFRGSGFQGPEAMQQQVADRHPEE